MDPINLVNLEVTLNDAHVRLGRLAENFVDAQSGAKEPWLVAIEFERWFIESCDEALRTDTE
jgi:hypothetical protein